MNKVVNINDKQFEVLDDFVKSIKNGEITQFAMIVNYKDGTTDSIFYNKEHKITWQDECCLANQLQCVVMYDTLNNMYMQDKN